MKGDSEVSAVYTWLAVMMPFVILGLGWKCGVKMNSRFIGNEFKELRRHLRREIP